MAWLCNNKSYVEGSMKTICIKLIIVSIFILFSNHSLAYTSACEDIYRQINDLSIEYHGQYTYPTLNQLIKNGQIDNVRENFKLSFSCEYAAIDFSKNNPSKEALLKFYRKCERKRIRHKRKIARLFSAMIENDYPF